MADKFYNQIGLSAALAVPGQAATPNQSIYTALTYLVAEQRVNPENGKLALDAVTHLVDPDGAKAGNFVWVVDGQVTNRAQFVEGETESTYDPVLPAGLVERVMDVANYYTLSEASDEVPPLNAATVAVKGDYYVRLSNPTSTTADGVAVAGAKVGDAVYVGLNGEVIAAAPGAEVVQAYVGDNGSSYTSPRLAETSWRFQTDTELGGIALISNWRD